MNKPIALISLILVTLVWGVTFTLTKSALSDVPALPLLAIRFLLASFCMLPFVFWKRDLRKQMNWQSTWIGAGIGLVLMLGYALQTFGLETTSPATSGFLTGLSVVIVPFISSVIQKKKRMGVRVWVGTWFAAGGLYLLCGPGLIHMQPGILEGLFCALFMALQIVMVEKAAPFISPLYLAFVEIATMSICFSIYSFLVYPHSVWNLANWLQPKVVISLLVNGIMGTSIAYWIQNVAQRYLSASQSAVIFTLEPVFAALVAWLLDQQKLGFFTWFGAFFILLGMWLSDTSIRWKITWKNHDEISQ
ncbi:DMT family transporter [Alicyclobacillus tolerans]|uniref:Drug/metabolite transporter (DMT)-like permease n=1 Tax=Alicyclobacillus tolerans TaxID=90970 RepID=A0ABT9LWV3_9BACL|nr:DMT family transporter [Alicyclobacillus tengchongensis]MDP9728719.1 drug/metabolite transporter (DMT)-like permease [Alicyclobacillus tengchongensis]